MRDLRPTPPTNLTPYARELLEALAGHPEAAEIVLGGGVAMSHYLEYRDTVDVDAWWRNEANPLARRLARESMEALAARHALQFHLRTWGETESYELLREGRKVFSFQIGTRTRFIDVPLPASWPPLMIETLRDNVASKMTALVERGAPRDLRDIHELCTRGFLDVAECWHLWAEKNPDRDPQEGRDKVRFHVQRLHLRRPLESIQSPEARAGAAALRHWFNDSFCASAGR
jgi:hypothetical protein